MSKPGRHNKPKFATPIPSANSGGKRKPDPRAAAQSVPSSRPPNRWRVLAIGSLTFLILVLIAVPALSKRFRSGRASRPLTPSAASTHPARGPLTYNKNIAPIVLQKCAPCHRPGQSAPFSLLTYSDVNKRTQQVAEVTARRYMPPWLPEPGHGDFAGARSLSDVELASIQRWIAEGAIEGDPRDLPATPVWPAGWQLGQPDLVVEMPPYLLSGDGKDIYRNLVAPVPLPANKFVKGVEFLAGNPKIVHHAFINVDETRQSRRLAAKQSPPGFDGMELPESANMPGGQLLGWQPGRSPYLLADGLSWVLKTNTDLVVQLHLHPSGKPETVAPKIGFYFTDHQPTNFPFRIKLARFDFEIPPGARDYVVEQSYVLPVPLELRRVLPHCHYLGKDLQSFAVLPNGTQQSLLWIKDWDFNWQGDYQYATPVALPQGTRLVMRYTYDNSTNNPRNPNLPLRPVRHGLQTTDEMAGLVFQAITQGPQDRARLAEDYFKYFVGVSMDYYQFQLRLDPNDAEAHTKLGRALFSRGQAREALTHLLSAVQIKPDDDRAHYELGFLYLNQQRWQEAYDEFQTVVRLNPDDYQAFGSLGYICLTLGRKPEARDHFEAALRLNPDDLIARKNLALLLQGK